MKKILFLPLVFVIGIGFSFILTSCLGSDDDDDTDEDWRTFQNDIFQKVAADKANYDTVVSQTGNGFIMWQDSRVIGNSDQSTRISTEGYPQFTDTVSVRYEGWYVDTENKRQIFDSTENPSLSNPNNPNKVPRQFAINVNPDGTSIIDGWKTALQRMKIGDEKLIVIPQQLGYGGSALTFIPAYTTLWFRIKLLDIIPMRSTN